MPPVYVFESSQTPPPELAPNRVLRRGGHFAAREAEASYRQVIGYEAINGPRTAFAGDVDVDVLVVWPQSKRGRLPDVDAHASLCKPAIDALADVGIFQDDSQIRRISYERRRGSVPLLRIEVREVMA